MDYSKNHSSTSLFVDLDGTLIYSDLLFESLLLLLRKNFFYIFYLPIWLIRGKAYLKHQLAIRTDLDLSLLPYNRELIDYLKQQKRDGCHLTLISASDQKLVKQIAHHLEIFDVAIGSAEGINLKGGNKLNEIRKLTEHGKFCYAGDSHADLVIWAAAESAIVIGANTALLNKVSALTNCIKSFPVQRHHGRAFSKALRPHQWLKNGLLFLPLLLSHQLFDLELLSLTSISFAAFCLCASSVYLLNDLLDLNNDRQHQSKRHRPFASAKLPLSYGVVASPILLIAAFITAFTVSVVFAQVLMLYWLITLSYSLVLKRFVLVDVLTLASLYSLRIIAGATAITVATTYWLLVFAMLFFLSLAIVKRYTELDKLKTRGLVSLIGRGYAVTDLNMLSKLGSGCGYLAVFVFGLYINSPETRMLYQQLAYLWLICPLLLYLIRRIWSMAYKGDFHEDPVVFALTDKPSQLIIALCALLVWLAI